MTEEDWKLLIPAAALVLSCISLYFTKANWRQSNRPIVTAFITEHHSGGSGTVFNLVVSNSGNRPAVRIRLHASQDTLRQIVAPGITSQRFEMIAQNFRADQEIPLLRNGEELTTSFGAYTPQVPDQAWLEYGAQCLITIIFHDLDGHRYKSLLPIKVYTRQGFGGGVWGDPT